jgi:uncharacterized repeat protein (TIGR01451 family)
VHTQGQDADELPGPSILAGEAVTWTYRVTNTGNVTLTSLTVIDSEGVAVTCPSDTLSKGQPMTCTASSIAAAGQYTNTGVATGLPPGGLQAVSDSDPSHYFGEVHELAIEKRTNGLDADVPPGPPILVGDAVTWSYRVTNTGNVPLIHISVEDDQEGPLVCGSEELAPGESTACEAHGVATYGRYTNKATVTGVPIGDWDPVSAYDLSHYLGAIPGVDLEKFTFGQDADTGTGPYVLAGDTVRWYYAVYNSGNVPLTGITVIDDVEGAAVCHKSTVAPGKSTVCLLEGTALLGQYTNSATVTATPPVGTDMTASDPSRYFGADPRIEVEKHILDLDADEPPGPTILVGEIVTWTYLLTNTGNVALVDVGVTDSGGIEVTCPHDTLEIQETMTCSSTGIAVAGHYSNTGTATGKPPGALSPVSDSDLSHYFGADPRVGLQKHTNGKDADQLPGPAILVGDTVTWTYRVTNVGNVTLSQIQVTDDQEEDLSCPATTLSAGETMTCTAHALAQLGQYANVGTVNATPLVGTAVEASDPSHYRGLLSFLYVYLPVVMR